MKEQNRKKNLIVLALGIVLIAVAAVSFTLGRYPVSLSELAEVVAHRVFGSGEIDPTLNSVVFNIRLPRILLACMVGCCLSAAGASYQGIFQNPMASPDILGASAGASFGAALAILLGGTGAMITASAFLFSILTVALVWLISQKAKGKRVLTLVLSGIMVSSLFSAGTSFIKLVADPTDQLPAITYWLMGSLSAAKMSDVAFAAIPMVIGIIPLLLLRWRINVLTLGDDEARTMGVNAGRVRMLAILSATLLTAASVAVSGVIGWVGLVIPHLARRLVGSNYRHLMPAAILFGAVFLLIVDNFSRNLFAAEIPLGVLTAFVGAPFFLYLITRGGDAG